MADPGGYVVGGSHYIRDSKFAKRMARKWADETLRPVKVTTYGGKLVYTAKPALRRNASKRSVRKRVAAALKKYVKSQNPARVKGRKVKGGRAVSLRNFTGTIVRKSDGRVEILGKGRK